MYACMYVRMYVYKSASRDGTAIAGYLSRSGPVSRWSRGGPFNSEAGLSVPKRAYLSRGGPATGLSIPRRAYISRGGPICPEAGNPNAGLSIPRRACPSRGVPIYPEAGLSASRWAYLSRSRPIYPEAGLKRWLSLGADQAAASIQGYLAPKKPPPPLGPP